MCDNYSCLRCQDMNTEWPDIDDVHEEDCSCDDCHAHHLHAADWAVVCQRCKEQDEYEKYMDAYYEGYTDII